MSIDDAVFWILLPILSIRLVLFILVRLRIRHMHGLRQRWVMYHLEKAASSIHDIADSEPSPERASVLRRAAADVSVIAERVRAR